MNQTRSIRSSVNFNKNEVKNIVIERLGVLPVFENINDVGRFVYVNDTTNHGMYYGGSTEWIKITVGTDIQVYTGTDPIMINNNVISLKDAGVLTKHLANNNVTFAKMQQLQSMKVVGNLGGTKANAVEVDVVKVITGEGNDTSLPTTSAVYKRIKELIDAETSATTHEIAGWNPNGATKFPSRQDGSLKKADIWYCTEIGSPTINGTTYFFEVGDALIAKADVPSATNKTYDHYVVLQTNIDKATVSTYGTVRLAAENVVQGTNAVVSANDVVTIGGLIKRVATKDIAGLVKKVSTKVEGDADGTAVPTYDLVKDIVNDAIEGETATSFIYNKWTTGSMLTLDLTTGVNKFSTKYAVINCLDIDGNEIVCPIRQVRGADGFITKIEIFANPAPTTADPINVYVGK